MPNDPSNPQLNFDDRRLWKTKKSAMLTSGGVGADLSYNAGQSAGALSRNSSVVSEKNIDGKDNFCGKLTQKSSGFDKLQKGSMGLDVPHGKLKQESSCRSNFV